MGKRDAAILNILNAEARVSVPELAERVGVSQVTLRKDLDDLAARGFVRREHGFACIANPNDLGGRLAFHYEEKLRLAERACELVADGETVMVENGSCCALLARMLFQRKRDVAIVTNSAYIANFVREEPGARTILLGGSYQNDAQVMVGPMVREAARSFHVGLLFAGTDGWSERGGFTNADLDRAQAVADMAESSERVVIVTESTKFSQVGIVSLRIGNKPTTVVTDAGIPELARQALEHEGIELVIA